MKNVMNLLMNSWYELLNGNISVPVYRASVPMEERGNHVLLRKESETEGSNKARYVTNPVVVVDITTVFDTVINDSVADEIDDEIAGLYTTLPGRNNLPTQTDIQILNVDKGQVTYLDEDDGVKKFYRHITRYTHRVNQN